MERKLWNNPSRRTTTWISRGAKPVSRNLSKVSGGLSGNKENISGEKKLKVLGGFTSNSKNERQGLKSRRSITRRLSFHKTDLEISEVSPFNCVGMQRDSDQDIDESMLCPLNSTRVTSSPSPFKVDLLQKGEAKSGFSSFEKQCHSSVFDSEKSSKEKIGISDHTKKILKDMGIETSPDTSVEKHGNFSGIYKKKGDDIKELSCVDKDTQTQHQMSEVLVKLSGMSDIVMGIHAEKHTQTTPQQPTLQAVELGKTSGECDALSQLVMVMENTQLRHFQEREDLFQRQKEEYGKIQSTISHMLQGGLNRTNASSGHRLHEDVPLLHCVTSGVGNEYTVQSAGASMCQAPSESVAGSSSQVTAQVNERTTPLIIIRDPETLISNLPDDGSPSQSANLMVDISIPKNKNPVSSANSDLLEGDVCLQDWRRREVSLIETPQAGKWLVTEELDEDIQLGNTPTLGLNSMLQGMSIQGQQTFMETPATRRMVTKRILKGVESLFL